MEKYIQFMFDYLKKPQLDAESSSKFWDDPHISKQMLAAHLDPDWEAASRKHSFIDKSVLWLNNAFPLANYQTLLDLGCGPGLYTQRLDALGYNVTGIDLSKRSLQYATEKAKETGADINYRCGNYLEIDFSGVYNLILMIYCDFGVLSSSSRRLLLAKIFDSLTINGCFVFDVFTPKQYATRVESQNWYINEGEGFWKADTHLCLESHYNYENQVILDQTVVIDQNGAVDVYRIWDHYFTREMIASELYAAGFSSLEFYSDVSGTTYDESTKILCIVATK